MTSVKSFRIDDILVGSHSKKRKGEMDVNMVTTVMATREEEIVKVDEDEDDDLSPSISPVLRSKLVEKRKEKKFMKRGKIEEGNTSTTSDDSGNSSRSSTPTDLSSTSAVTIKTTASEAPKTPLPSTSTALSSSDEGNNSNHSKGEDEKSSEGESETQPEQINNELGNISAGGTPIGNGVPMLGGSGFYPYANHPHFPIMFPMTSSGRVSVSQEEKGYPSAPSLHFSAAASATGSALVDPFLSKGRPFFGGPRHPSSGLMALGMPPTAMDFSMYSQHHPSFPGGFYGLPNMHEAATTQQKAHHQQLMNERLNCKEAILTNYVDYWLYWQHPCKLIRLFILDKKKSVVS